IKAARLISKGALTPCQSARLYWGNWSASTELAAEFSSRPTVHCGKIPTTRQQTARSSTGSRIQRDGSCGSFGVWVGAGPKNTCTKRNEYATPNTPITTAATDIHQPLPQLKLS